MTAPFRFLKPLKWWEVYQSLNAGLGGAAREAAPPPKPPVLKGWTTTPPSKKAAIWDATVAWSTQHDIKGLTSSLTDDDFVAYEADGATGVPEATYEIVPGESIGPYRLGMTSDELSEQSCPRGDIQTTLDDTGKCCEVEAIVATDDPTYVLAGIIVNRIEESATQEIFQVLSPDLEWGYATLCLPTLGLRAIKWEHSDPDFYAISVVPPRPGAKPKQGPRVFGTNIVPRDMQS